jgi:hypothetical protein
MRKKSVFGLFLGGAAVYRCDIWVVLKGHGFSRAAKPAENTFALQRLRGALSGGRHLVYSLFSRKGASRKLLWYKP